MFMLRSVLAWRLVPLFGAALLAACGELEAMGDEGLATEGQEIRVLNSLSTQALLFNALSANPEASQKMVALPLATATYAASGEPALNTQLLDPYARDFFGYVVSCALGPAQSVTWSPPLSPPRYLWRGQVGLCPAWATGPADAECQQRVSACVLARNNALGVRVELSMRGERRPDNAPFALAPKVPVDSKRPFLASDVPSTRPCAAPASGADRNCGWSRREVGRCNPAASVEVRAKGTLPGGVVLRACSGLSACDAGDPRVLAQAGNGVEDPIVSFTCPGEGTFGLTTAPFDSAGDPSSALYVEGATYPASESEVYAVREGAFFGTLFGPGALRKGVRVFVDPNGRVRRPRYEIPGAVYTRMFACHAPGWSDGKAYLSSRLCALPGANCAAEPVGACGTACKVDDGSLVPGDGDFEECASASDGWRFPATSFLNVPCALFRAEKDPACGRVDAPQR
ncbi:MAG TPA: hypothetical protein VEY30_04180 [Myxococcaceae bacterium]|nr:hypothetical protein [Myxococcaceae bacterium]